MIKMPNKFCLGILLGEKKKIVPAKLKDIQEGNSEHIICSQML